MLENKFFYLNNIGIQVLKEQENVYVIHLKVRKYLACKIQ